MSTAELMKHIDDLAQFIENLKAEVAKLTKALSSVGEDMFEIKVTNIPLDINVKAVESTITFNVEVTNTPIDINVKAVDSAVTFNVAVQNTPLDINITAVESTVTFNVNVQNTPLGVNITAVDSTITFNVKITNTPLDVNITAVESTVTFNVNVQGTANVNIAGATVYLNIKNEDNAKYAKEIYTDNGVVYSWITWNDYHTVFFPHGCRGHLEKIRIYCRNTSSSAISVDFGLKITPQSPPIYTITLNLDANASEGWYEITVNKWWDYDSLAIEQLTQPAGFEKGNASGGSNNTFYSTDRITYIPIGWRLMFRAVIHTTVGDIPVSGTVNTINIPNTTSGSSASGADVPGGDTCTLLNLEGTGTLKYACFQTFFTGWYIRFYVDGKLIRGHLAETTIYPLGEYDLQETNPSLGVRVLKWDTTGNEYVIEWNIPINFKKSLRIEAYNPDTSAHSITLIRCIYDLIS
ncbi:MAG: hypothetical protein ACTSR0_04035 [Candidatus Asgardarchaeia archaeon]